MIATLGHLPLAGHVRESQSARSLVPRPMPSMLSRLLLTTLQFQANFTNLEVSGGGDVQNSTSLTAALQLAQESGQLQDAYQIHLWNYCVENSDTGKRNCTSRSGNFYFDPIEAWGLNATNATDSNDIAGGNNPVSDRINELQNNYEDLQNELLGDAGSKAMDAYRHVSRWMFIAYAVSFWTSLATIVLGLLAIFSRWGSLLTWIAALVSRSFHPSFPHLSLFPN